MLTFLENSCSFRCFQSDGKFIPDPRRSDTESMFAALPMLSLVLGTISCCEMDFLSFLGIFER